MDAGYQEALRKRDDLKRQLAEVEELLRLWRRVFGDGEAGAEATESTPQALKQNGAVRPKRSPTRKRAAQIARKVILEKGAPMTRGELLAAFESEGAPIAGADPSRNMGTIMWRLKDQFRNIEGEGYWPIDAPPPKGLPYQPELHGDGETESTKNA